MTDRDHSEPSAQAPRDAGAAPPGRFWALAGLALAAAMAVTIAVLTLTPTPPRQLTGQGLDKLFHGLGFAALVFPAIATDSRRWIWVVPLAIAFGGAIELIQPSVGRAAEWLDFGANVVGVLTGAALGELLHDHWRDRSTPSDPVRDPVAGPADIDTGTDSGHDLRGEAMRAELAADLRTVLREELASVRPRDLPAGATDAAVGPERPERPEAPARPQPPRA